MGDTENGGYRFEEVEPWMAARGLYITYVGNEFGNRFGEGFVAKFRLSHGKKMASFSNIAGT